MKISTKGRYAVRVMLDLALHDNGDYNKVKNIADRQGLSEKYLEQIISILNRAGFVKSTRGTQGGYKIAKSPDQYTVGMVLRLTEGTMSPVSCLDGDDSACERCDTCEPISVWRDLAEAINGVVDNVTIADLVKQHKEKGNSSEYSI